MARPKAREDQTPRDAAALLRRLLDAVEQGEIDAGSPADGRLRRRLEGAVVALEAMREATPSPEA